MNRNTLRIRINTNFSSNNEPQYTISPTSYMNHKRKANHSCSEEIIMPPPPTKRMKKSLQWKDDLVEYKIIPHNKDPEWRSTYFINDTYPTTPVILDIKESISPFHYSLDDSYQPTLSLADLSNAIFNQLDFEWDNIDNHHDHESCSITRNSTPLLQSIEDIEDYDPTNNLLSDSDESNDSNDIIDYSSASNHHVMNEFLALSPLSDHEYQSTLGIYSPPTYKHVEQHVSSTACAITTTIDTNTATNTTIQDPIVETVITTSTPTLSESDTSVIIDNDPPPLSLDVLLEVQQDRERKSVEKKNHNNPKHKPKHELKDGRIPVFRVNMPYTMYTVQYNQSNLIHLVVIHELEQVFVNGKELGGVIVKTLSNVGRLFNDFKSPEHRIEMRLRTTKQREEGQLCNKLLTHAGVRKFLGLHCMKKETAFRNWIIIYLLPCIPKGNGFTSNVRSALQRFNIEL